MTHRQVDCVVVGAGFAGLYMVHRFVEMGLSVQGVDRAEDVGGTWYWNRYPGARCDIESVDYCYSFDDDLLDEWRWPERYSAQPDILRYLEHVADRFDLRRHFSFGVDVTSAHWHERSHTWLITLNTGDTLRATYCVMATGNLSVTKDPEFPGLDTFDGEWFHTGNWPQEPVDFSGRRVAVIGTGSSGIQAITEVAKHADKLYVCQRTPNYSMPAHNHPLDENYVQTVLGNYWERRRASMYSDDGTPLPPPTRSALQVSEEEREKAYEEGWARGGISSLSGVFNDFFVDERANETAQEFARRKIRQIVNDPEVADLLCPTHHIGTKRTATDTGYFETFNRPNVELVDVRSDPIVEIVPEGIRTRDRVIHVDAIIFAIGFDAMTGALADIEIVGTEGSLSEAWNAGPRTYLGLQSAGFPNLFMITGPGSPSVLSNMTVSIEQHVDWIAETIDYLRTHNLDRIEPTAEAQDAWVRHVCELAEGTLYLKARSWYLGDNIEGKPRIFMPYVGGCGQYRKTCDEVVTDGYRGFVLNRPVESLAKEMS